MVQKSTYDCRSLQLESGPNVALSQPRQQLEGKLDMKSGHQEKPEPARINWSPRLSLISSNVSDVCDLQGKLLTLTPQRTHAWLGTLRTQRRQTRVHRCPHTKQVNSLESRLPRAWCRVPPGTILKRVTGNGKRCFTLPMKAHSFSWDDP